MSPTLLSQPSFVAAHPAPKLLLPAVIIDDSTTIRACLKAWLPKAGFRVVAEGTTGKQAVALFKEHRPALITLDIVLPEMDGVAAAGNILREFPDANVVTCSSLSARDKAIACRQLGVRRFLLKPLTEEKLVQAVRTIWEQLAVEHPNMEQAP
ncbi:MAG: response regulator [Myxococcota bacterium]